MQPFYVRKLLLLALECVNIGIVKASALPGETSKQGIILWRPTRKSFSTRTLFALFSGGAIALFMAIASLEAAIGSGTKFEETFELEKRISGERVEIKHSHGNIQIHGWDRSDLKITGTEVSRSKKSKSI
jgi:hypothetical protein